MTWASQFLNSSMYPLLDHLKLVLDQGPRAPHSALSGLVHVFVHISSKNLLSVGLCLSTDMQTLSYIQNRFLSFQKQNRLASKLSSPMVLVFGTIYHVTSKKFHLSATLRNGSNSIYIQFTFLVCLYVFFILLVSCASSLKNGYIINVCMCTLTGTANLFLILDDI